MCDILMPIVKSIRFLPPSVSLRHKVGEKCNSLIIVADKIFEHLWIMFACSKILSSSTLKPVWKFSPRREAEENGFLPLRLLNSTSGKNKLKIRISRIRNVSVREVFIVLFTARESSANLFMEFVEVEAATSPDAS